MYTLDMLPSNNETKSIEGEVKKIIEEKGKGGWIRVQECVKEYAKKPPQKEGEAEIDGSKRIKFYRWRTKVEEKEVKGFQYLPLGKNISYIGLDSANPQAISSKEKPSYSRSSEVEFKVREIHTKNLKEKVIEPWLSLLDMNFPKIPPELNPFEVSPPKPSIDEILFKDLRNHINGKIFDDYDNFNDLIKEIGQKKDEILKLINGQVLNAFKDLGLEISDDWRRKRFVRPVLPVKIFEAAYYREVDEKRFIEVKNYIADSTVEGDEYKIIGTVYLMLQGLYADKVAENERHLLEIAKKDRDEAEKEIKRLKKEREVKLKNTVDKKLQVLLDEVETAVYKVKMNGLIKLLKKAEKIQQKLKSELTKCSYMVTFSGNCEYTNQ